MLHAYTWYTCILFVVLFQMLSVHVLITGTESIIAYLFFCLQVTFIELYTSITAVNDDELEILNNLQYDGGWKLHINSIHEKTCKRLNLLKLVKHTLSRCFLKKIYFSFIRLVLEYADIVWENCSSIQVSAARISYQV